MGAVAGKKDLTITAGATWADRVRYRVKSTGLPIDITGWSARLQVRESAAATTAVLNLTTGAGLTVNGPAGIVDINATAEQTAPLVTAGVSAGYVWGLELFRTVDDVVQVIPLLQGALTAQPRPAPVVVT